MSDLHPMYARLRGSLVDDQPIHADRPACAHPRRQQRIVTTEEPGPVSYAGYLVNVTNEINCDGCDTVIGRETHTERRR